MDRTATSPQPVPAPTGPWRCALPRCTEPVFAGTTRCRAHGPSSASASADPHRMRTLLADVARSDLAPGDRLPDDPGSGEDRPRFVTVRLDAALWDELRRYA